MSELKVDKEEVKQVEVSKEEVKQVKVEKEEVKVVDKKAVDNNNDIFITEEDRFTIPIKYYLEDREPVIEGFSDAYLPNEKEIHSFDVYFKYPSQKDVEYIMSVKPIQNIESAEILDFIELENVRLITLLRGWSMERSLEDLAQIHPTIVKALRAKISEKIAGNGLF
jgi:hypothetical protein